MEENTINDLYLKYTDSIGESLEDDRYFQYLFEIVQAGNNTLQQKHRILHKVVDEQWLTVVEEGINAIFNIVDKPRRFITTSEEVVPVALARKITADSVRHLSQHTQFIAANAKGEIQPTKILNVTTEESYDLYENRFVYHLIQRLFAFVDKRTDVIFWATGDETCDVMSMESSIDDAYEEISYKVEMKIKNRQSLVENDADNMSVFKRIDRVRRMSRTLRSSAFCEIMNGCARVHSPIQRTNLMMKDPDYRTCYKLWQFIENYDEVGYSIEEQDSALEFDEEYLLQMYINLITNYTVFKSLLESDPRKMSEIALEKKEPVKPKFVKEIKEEIVDDYNIPDVEVRKVIIEEVTQAQLDAEAKLAEETAHREELEKELSNLQSQLDAMNQQLEFTMDQQAQLENEKAAVEAQLDAEKSARLTAEETAETTREQARMQIDAAQAEAKEAVEAAAREAQEQLAQAQQKAEEEMAALKKEKADELAAAEKDAETRIAALQAEAQRQIAEAQQEAEAEIERIRWEARSQVEAAQTEAKKQTEQAQAEAKRQTEQAQTEAKKQTEQAQAEARSRVQKAEKEKEAAKEAQARAEAARSEADRNAAAAQLEAQHAKKEAAESKQKCAEAVARAEQAQLERKAALAEAEEQADRAKKEAEEQVCKAQKKAQAEAEKQIEHARKEAQEKIQKAEAEAQRARDEAEEKIALAQAEVQREMESVRKACEEAVSVAESARAKAVAKAEANSLSHYLVTALRERKERRQNPKEEDK